LSKIDALESMLAKGPDNALLRFGLGSEYLNAERYDEAVTQLAKAVEMSPRHSAAWKLYAKALALKGATEQAIGAYEQGIAVATAQGDVQAAKEMQVFLKRLNRDQRP
jgi:Tfp pilus assembly protein PilF